MSTSPLILETTPAGNDLDVLRDIPGVTLGDPITKAWLTIKVNRSDVDPGALQKIVSATAVAGVGQIAADGSSGNGDGTASVYFQLTAAETTTLGTSIRYFWDIKCRTASGKLYTSGDPDTGRTIGRLLLKPQITQATS